MRLLLQRNASDLKKLFVISAVHINWAKIIASSVYSNSREVATSVSRMEESSVESSPSKKIKCDKQLQMGIDLTRVEKDVFETLGSAVNDMGYSTVVRVAGGWVRDKILKRQCDDIDVVVDDCSGIVFAERINSYLRDVKKEHVGRIGLITARPDQSKHLETAAFKIHGHEGECVKI